MNRSQAPGENMTSQEFWKLIELTDKELLANGDDEGSLEKLQKKLDKMPQEELYAFDRWLAQFLYDIDGRVYAENCDDAGASDDSFLYVRCFVVAMGKEHYESVKSDPKKMPKSLDHWCESLLHVAGNAWAKQNDKDPTDYDFTSEVSYETGSNEKLWQ
jgi:hypothetical protein